VNEPDKEFALELVLQDAGEEDERKVATGNHRLRIYTNMDDKEMSQLDSIFALIHRMGWNVDIETNLPIISQLAEDIRHWRTWVSICVRLALEKMWSRNPDIMLRTSRRQREKIFSCLSTLAVAHGDRRRTLMKETMSLVSSFHLTGDDHLTEDLLKHALVTIALQVRSSAGQSPAMRKVDDIVDNTPENRDVAEESKSQNDLDTVEVQIHHTNPKARDTTFFLPTPRSLQHKEIDNVSLLANKISEGMQIDPHRLSL
jgi:hypothetical protein